MATETTNYKFKKPDTTDFYNIADQNGNWEECDKQLKELNNGKAATTHKHTKAEIADLPTKLPADGGNADTVGNLTPNKLVQWIPNLTAEILNNSAYAINYEGDVSPEIAVQIGLPNCWWHAKYQRHSNTTGGYGLQTFYPLNAPTQKPYFRDSSSTIWNPLRRNDGSVIVQGVVLNASSWVEDSTYTAYGYTVRSAVPIPNVYWTFKPEAIYDVTQIFDDNLAPFIVSYDNGVYFYAKTKLTGNITIPEISCRP